MIALAALAVVLFGAGWLVLVGILSALRPEVARAGLTRMGSSWRIQLGEHIPRAFVGAGLILRAAQSKVPVLFEIGGWFILASSILILLLPMHWHHAYAVWWAERIPLPAYRLFALPTAAAGAMLAYAAF